MWKLPCDSLLPEQARRFHPSAAYPWRWWKRLGSPASKVPAVSELSPQSAKCSSSGFSFWHLPWPARDKGLGLSPTWVVNSSSPATRNRTVSLSPHLPLLVSRCVCCIGIVHWCVMYPSLQGYNRLSTHANARCVHWHGLLEAALQFATAGAATKL